MTKFNLSLWDDKKTINENAQSIGICYNYAAVLARRNSLTYIRRRSKKYKTFGNIQEFTLAKDAGKLFYGVAVYSCVDGKVKQLNNFELKDEWRQDVPIMQDPINFEWSGAD